jgi:hypothetical protein
MTTDVAHAVEMARDATEGRPLDQFLERLAERIGGRASVKAVFGEPTDRGDLTVVPIARVRLRSCPQERSTTTRPAGSEPRSSPLCPI